MSQTKYVEMNRGNRTGENRTDDELMMSRTDKRKQNWMNSSILNKMEERRKYKNMHTEEGEKKNKEFEHEIQKLS